MEEMNMNQRQRDPFAVRRGSDVRQLTKAIDDLQSAVEGATMIWGTGKCMLDKKEVMDKVLQIVSLLPDAIKAADGIIKEEQSILDTARREAGDATNKARDEAQKTIDQAARDADKTRAESKKAAEEAARANANAMNTANTLKAQAESEAAAIRQNAQNAANALYNKAQQDANAMTMRAGQEAQLIVAEAEAKARAAVANENVYKMAVHAANELREETEKEMAVMRQSYINGLYNVMGEMDDYLVSLVNNIRAERQNLVNKS